MLLWEVCTGEPPIRGTLRPLVAPVDAPQQVADLQRRCVAMDPLQRPTISEIVQVLDGATMPLQPPPGAPACPSPVGSAGPQPAHPGGVLRSVVIDRGPCPVPWLDVPQQGGHEQRSQEQGEAGPGHCSCINPTAASTATEARLTFQELQGRALMLQSGGE